MYPRKKHILPYELMKNPKAHDGKMAMLKKLMGGVF